MPFLDKIVKGLNGMWVKGSLTNIPEGKIKAFGIAETIINPDPNDASKFERFPALINDDGEIMSIEPDDNYSIILYHKLESISNSQLPKQAFGDSRGDMQEVANMSLIFIAFRDDIRKPLYHFEALLKDAMQATMKLKSEAGSVMQLSYFKPGTSSFDGVLFKEYSDIKWTSPLYNAFEMKYQIVSTWTPGCYTCNCEAQ